MWCKWSCHEACPGTDNRNIFGLYLICFGSVYFCLESDLSELCPNLNESEGICGLLVFCKATVCRWIVSSEDIYFDNMSLISNTQCILILDWGKDRTFFFFFLEIIIHRGLFSSPFHNSKHSCCRNPTTYCFKAFSFELFNTLSFPETAIDRNWRERERGRKGGVGAA